MIKPDWIDDELAHTTMKYTLSKMALIMVRHKKYLVLNHMEYTPKQRTD